MPNANSIDSHVGSRLKALRLQGSLEVESLASRLDISSARLRDFEDGVERMPAAIMIRVCGVLGARPDQFFERISEDAGHAESAARC